MSKAMAGNYIPEIVPEAGIKGKDKEMHLTDTVGFNYLSPPLTPASDATFHNNVEYKYPSSS